MKMYFCPMAIENCQNFSLKKSVKSENNRAAHFSFQKTIWEYLGACMEHLSLIGKAGLYGCFTSYL